jgi:hypothetical protein
LTRLRKMPTSAVKTLMAEVKAMKEGFELHLRESVGIKTELQWHKWLLALIAAKLISEWFVR